MKTLHKTLLAGLILAVGMAAPVAIASEVQSLRGDNDLAAGATEFDRKKAMTASGGFERSWELQPPTIPHNTDNDRITLKENTCLSCHSKANFEKEKAPMIGKSHFVDASGNVLEDMNQRRHFCTQCHVPQYDANPLVENTFAGK